jgi:hypothetical protein
VLWGVGRNEAVKARIVEGFAFSGVLWFGTRPTWGPDWTSFSGVGSLILRGRTGPGYEGRPTWWGRKDLNGERGELEKEEGRGRGHKSDFELSRQQKSVRPWPLRLAERENDVLSLLGIYNVMPQNDQIKTRCLLSSGIIFFGRRPLLVFRYNSAPNG